ncbi:MAG: hydroxyacid dehydrogenase [Clostridiaceae bacterium]|jgi:phosphoglycerate dehydrogenase-like enzyme|nr:hydroxyacid dehydrogenase [Clostridiaceae bacterium]
MLKGLYILNRDAYEKIYNNETRLEIGRIVDIYAPPQTAESISRNLSLLARADVIFSGWGAPVMDEKFLKAAPNLKAVFYGAGSVKYFVTDAFWERNILITSAYAANAVPVSEFTLSQILFCLKRGWHFVNYIRKNGSYPEQRFVPGAYGSTVGLISLGSIGQRVLGLLKHFDLNAIAYDPYISCEKAKELGVVLCPLDEIFKLSDVVSVHTPRLKETENMIRGRHFRLMKKGASFINTARGAIVCEAEMIEVFKERPDLHAVLDVTWPEPPEKNSPLYTLENITLTPHIAGAMDSECGRMGGYMLEELKRFIDGQPLKWAITRKQASIMA